MLKWTFRLIEQKSVASPNRHNMHFYGLRSFALLLTYYNLVLYNSSDNEKGDDPEGWSSQDSQKSFVYSKVLL